MIALVAEHGYRDTAIQDVATAAGVSTKSYYELFSSKEDCFLSAYDLLLDAILAQTAHAFESKADATWSERIAAGLRVLLSQLAKHPDQGRFVMIEALAVGRQALGRRDAALWRFTEFLDVGRGETPVDLPTMTSLSVAGGIYELFFGEILRGTTAQLPSRLPELMFWIMVPLLGLERAADEQIRAQLSLAEATSSPRAEPFGRETGYRGRRLII